jgi:hypothetical protein
MTEQERTQVHAALFVDFDNMYIRLSELDRIAANRFATNPSRWLTWLERDMPGICGDSGQVKRRILIRRCYLNTDVFKDFRPYFTLSAFELVDCPPLTVRGKTSADIRMVIDILDALDHVTNFDEFIILSADTDFAPVLLRLRMFNRYSSVLSIGNISLAYKASCDYLVSQDDFLRDALGIAAVEAEVEEDEGGAQAEAAADIPEALLSDMAARLYEAAVLPAGVEANQLPMVYKEFPEFRQSNHWLGFTSLRNLTQAIVQKRLDLKIIEDDPWRVVRVVPARSATAVLKSKPDVTDEKQQQDIRKAIAEWIKGILGESRSPVTMAVLAQGVNEKFGEYTANSNWLGAGTFKNLLTQLDLGKLKLFTPTPGYVYDPARHEIPSGVLPGGREPMESPVEQVDGFLVKYPEIAPLARKIHQLTETPYLMPEHYAVLFQELARQINEEGYQLTRTSKTVRDRCVEKGAPVARAHVNFALFGIGYAGHRLGQELPERAENLAECMVQNTVNLCRAAQLNLSEQDKENIHAWLAGPPEQAAPAP